MNLYPSWTIENIRVMTDAELAKNSAIYQHKLNVADDNDDWQGMERFAEIVNMIEQERERRAGSHSD